MKHIFTAIKGTYTVFACMEEGDPNVPAALVRQGVIPSSPYRPTFGVATRLLQMYHRIHVRCPHLAIQPFIRGLCDLHGVCYIFISNDSFTHV